MRLSPSFAYLDIGEILREMTDAPEEIGRDGGRTRLDVSWMRERWLSGATKKKIPSFFPKKRQQGDWLYPPTCQHPAFSGL